MYLINKFIKVISPPKNLNDNVNKSAEKLKVEGFPQSFMADGISC